MTLLRKFLSCGALALTALALPALAASTAGSSASDSASSAASSASDSLKTSSGSSKGTDVKQGEYKIIDIATAPDRPDSVRITLQALAQGDADGPLQLFVPARVFERSELAHGQVISARTRAYGVEFAKGSPRAAFFLVLHDEVYRELNSVAVSL